MQIVKSSFKGCGNVFEDGIGYTIHTEPESDVRLDIYV